MKFDYYSNSKDYINRWVISYADFITMLLALFIVLFAISDNDKNDLNNVLNEKFEKKAISKTEERYSQNENLKYVKKLDKEEIKEKNNITKDLQESLSKEFYTDTSLSVVNDPRGIIIRINDTMLFDEGSAIIKPEAKPALLKIITELQTINNPIIIEGHTDAIPIKNLKYNSNWELSTARATNIIEFILNTKKIDAKRLSALGYGDNIPIGDNATREGRAKNRRVDIIVLNRMN